jgi:hypothetical protein
MHRRLMIAALACVPAARLLAQGDPPLPRHKVSAAQLHGALAARFPLRAAVAGLLELQVSAPRLLLLPARNRLGATLLVEVGGGQWQQLQSGELDVAFALRYERADQTVRGHQLDVLALRWPGLPPETLPLVQRALATTARDGLGEIVLHKFTPRELALPQTMGFEPAGVTVVDDGLVVEFAPKGK